MKNFRRRMRYRFQTKSPPHRRIKWKKAILPLSLAFLLFSALGIERRLGPLAQESALSILNGELVKEINLSVTEVLEEENIYAGSILQEEKDDAGRLNG